MAIDPGTIGNYQYASTRSQTIGGIQYEKDAPVDTSSLPDHKISQFLRQRLIRPINNSPDQRDATSR